MLFLVNQYIYSDIKVFLIIHFWLLGFSFYPQRQADGCIIHTSLLLPPLPPPVESPIVRYTPA